MQAGFGLLGVGLERAGAAVDQRDLQIVGARGGCGGEHTRQSRKRDQTLPHSILPSLARADFCAPMRRAA